MMNCVEYIQKYLDTLKSGFSCIPQKDYIRIITPYLYPDNDFIEIYVREEGDVYTFTDLGETLRHLYSQGYDVFGTQKRKYLFDVVLSNSGISFENGKLIKSVSREKIGVTLFEIISTSKSIGDFIFTSRSYEPATFMEEVENFLLENGIKYYLNVKFKGKSNTNYKIDFELLNHHKIFLDALSPMNARGSTTKVNASFRKWSDINHDTTKLSLLNDSDNLWKESDIILLNQVSEVIFWSKKERIIEIVKSD